MTPTRLTLTYSDGPHNAESVVYDARSGRLIVITKVLLGHVYTTGPDAFAHRTAVLHEVAAAPVIATDAALLPGGRAVVVRTYGAATVYRYPPGSQSRRSRSRCSAKVSRSPASRAAGGLGRQRGNRLSGVVGAVTSRGSQAAARSE